MTAPANTIQILYIMKGRETPKRAVSTSENHKHTQLFVTDSISERYFLVDTRAQVSVTPTSKLNKKTGFRGPPLQTANVSIITAYDTHVVCLRYS